MWLPYTLELHHVLQETDIDKWGKILVMFMLGSSEATHRLHLPIWFNLSNSQVV